MTDIFFAQILILFLQYITLYRPFSKHFIQTYYHKDVLSIVPLISLVIIVLSFFAFSLQISLILLFLLGLLIFFLNLPRTLSFIGGMQKDFFSLPFKIVSAFLLILSLSLFLLLSIYRPLPNKISDLVTNKTLYYGSHRSGFFERRGLFNAFTAEKVEIFPSENTFTNDKDLQIVVCIPDFCYDIEDTYKTAVNIANKGYKVVLFDFFSRDTEGFSVFRQGKNIKNFHEKLYLAFKPEIYEQEKQNLIEQKRKEMLSAMSLIYSEKPEPFFIIADGLSYEAALILQKNFPSIIQGIYTSGAKSLFEQRREEGLSSFLTTKPLDAKILNIQKTLSSRDFAKEADAFFSAISQKRLQEENKNDSL